MIDFFVGAGVASTVFGIAAAVAYTYALDRFEDMRTQCFDLVRENALLRIKMASGEARLGKVRADLDNSQAEVSALRDRCDYWRAKANRKSAAEPLAAIRARTTAELRGAA